MSGSVSKVAADRNQRILLELVAQPGNDVCADCKSKNPRWASHNLGIFICVHCAAIHRKMGTHISKVKSLTLDTWTKEQVEHMKNTGNVKSNNRYNPDEVRNPPPTNMVEAERDSELEKYIRSKYEFKRFMARGSAMAEQLLGPSRSVSKVSPSRSKTTPSPSRATTSTIATSTSAPQYRPTSMNPAPTTQPLRSNTLSNPSAYSQPQAMSQPHPPLSQPQVQKPSSNPVWDDLVSLQAPAMNSTLPLQIAPSPSVAPMSQQPSITGMGYSFNNVGAYPTGFAPNPTGFNNLSAASAGYSSLAAHPTGFSPSMSYNTMVGSSASSLGVTGMAVSPGSMPNLASAMNSATPFQQGLQPPSTFTGPSSAPSFSPLNGMHMQSNAFSQPQPFPPQQFQHSPMMTGAPGQQYFQPQPQSFTPSPQPQFTLPPPFGTTPSPIPMPGMGQQFQQPGWGAVQPQAGGYMGQTGQWGAM